MKTTFLTLLTSLTLTSVAVAETAPYTLLLDPHMSPYAGAEDIMLVHRLIEVGEDRLELFQGKNSLAALGRLIELTMFWDPLNIIFDVTQHEVFGHGYRLRSFGPDIAKVHSYNISFNGGLTSFSITDQMTLGQYAAVDVAGIEAESILSSTIKMKWATANMCYARQNSLYFYSKLSPLLYSLTLVDPSIDVSSAEFTIVDVPGKPDIFTGHDIKTYQILLNTFYPDLHLTTNDLIHATLWNLADATLINGIASWWTYVFYGKNAPFWMIKITDNIRYLPSASTVLAPYGIEYKVDNYLMVGNKLYTFYAKGGSCTGTKFGGGGFYMPSVFEGRYGTLGLNMDMWQQPDFLNTATMEQWDDSLSLSPEFPLNGHFWGAHAGTVININLLKSKSLQFTTYTGYKTKGYLPGFSLDSGGYIRIGLTTQF